MHRPQLHGRYQITLLLLYWNIWDNALAPLLSSCFFFKYLRIFSYQYDSKNCPNMMRVHTEVIDSFPIVKMKISPDAYFGWTDQLCQVSLLLCYLGFMLKFLLTIALLCNIWTRLMKDVSLKIITLFVIENVIFFLFYCINLTLQKATKVLRIYILRQFLFWNL